MPKRSQKYAVLIRWGTFRPDLVGRLQIIGAITAVTALIGLTVILFIRCFGRAARRAESNERCAPTGQGDRLAPAAGRGAASAAFFLAFESDDAGAGGADHGAGGGVTS
jgi:hypothetical protein